MQAVSLDLQAQVAAAVSAERFSEADALQGELDAAAADAAALKAGHDFTDKDLGSSLQSLSHLSTVEDGAAAQQAEALSSSIPDIGDRNSPQSLALSIDQPLKNGRDAEPEGDSGLQTDLKGVNELDARHEGESEPHTKLKEVAAAEAARPTSVQLPPSLQLQRRPDSGSRQQLAVNALTRQLTDERTLSGYITDSDSAAEAPPIARGDSEVSSNELPAAKHLQSAKSREQLSAGMNPSLSLFTSMLT